MSKSACLLQAVADIEEAYSNCPLNSLSEVRLGNILASLDPVGLTVLTGGDERQHALLASNLTFQMVFRQGVGCIVFCADVKAFVTGQLSIVSGVGIGKLYSGEIGSEDWSYIAHAMDSIDRAPLLLSVLPASLELLKESVRVYAAKCNAKSGGETFLIFDLPQLIDGQTTIEKAMRELSELSVEVDRSVVVVHDTKGLHAHAEQDAISQYATSILTLEAMPGELPDCCLLSSIAKSRALPSTMRLRFDLERFTVYPADLTGCDQSN